METDTLDQTLYTTRRQPADMDGLATVMVTDMLAVCQRNVKRGQPTDWLQNFC